MRTNEAINRAKLEEISYGGEWIDYTVADLAPFSYGKGLPERERNPQAAFLYMAQMGSSGFMASH